MHEETFQQNSEFEVFDRNKTSDVHGLLNEIEIVDQSSISAKTLSCFSGPGGHLHGLIVFKRFQPSRI